MSLNSGTWTLSLELEPDRWISAAFSEAASQEESTLTIILDFDKRRALC
jgi:hypothetical protein